MIIDCIADCHGFYPELEGGDLLIVAGDLTARDTLGEHCDFKTWLYEQNYRKKVVIAGNHDNHFVGLPGDEYIFSSYNVDTLEQKSCADYLCDSGTEFEGLKIWGSPWTKTFEGMNPHCKAFTCDTEEELAEKWALIPGDIDILITHSPPSGFFDEVLHESKWGNHRENVGSKSLRNMVMDLIKPQLHVFGHIHEWGGKQVDCITTRFVNASYVNERYEPINKPVRVIL